MLWLDHGPRFHEWQPDPDRAKQHHATDLVMEATRFPMDIMSTLTKDVVVMVAMNVQARQDRVVNA